MGGVGWQGEGQKASGIHGYMYEDVDNYRWLLVCCEIFTTISCNVAIWLTNLPFLIRVQTMLIMDKCQAMVMHWENHFILIYLLWTHLAAPHESKTFWAFWWQISLLLQTTLNNCKDQYTCNVYGYTVYVWYILKFTCFFCFLGGEGGGTDLEFFKPTTTVYNNLVFQCMST